MQEISLHILDILQNAREAGANRILLWVLEDRCRDILKFKVADNGKGMPPELAVKSFSPFVSSRQTRKVGLGLAMLKATAQASGGYAKLSSQPGRGTRVEGVFRYSHLDRPPLGNLPGSISVFLVGNPQVHFRYVHRKNGIRKVFDSVSFVEKVGAQSLQETWVFPLLLSSLESMFKSDERRCFDEIPGRAAKNQS